MSRENADEDLPLVPLAASLGSDSEVALLQKFQIQHQYQLEMEVGPTRSIL